jgi:hypothetical protein
VAVLATSGVVLGAWYMLSLVRQVFFGPLREPHGLHGEPHPAADLSPREVAALGSLCVFIVWIGLCPDFFLSRMAPTLDRLAAPAVAAWDARGVAGNPKYEARNSKQIQVTRNTNDTNAWWQTPIEVMSVAVPESDVETKGDLPPSVNRSQQTALSDNPF